MSGALIGTAVAILLMFRKVRPPSQAELNALRANLETAESSLAAATAASEDLRKQIAERDRSIHLSTEELNEKQRQLGFAIAEAEKAAAERSAAEQKAREVSAEAAEITGRRAELEARLEEEKKRVAEQASQHVASFEAQLDAGKLQIQELGGEVARLTAQCAELKTQHAAGTGTERTTDWPDRGTANRQAVRSQKHRVAVDGPAEPVPLRQAR